MRVVAERFELVEEIGRGATGSVWVAVDRHLDRPVAVKLLHRELLENPVAYASFEHEAKTAAQVQIPNVVRIYDAGVDQGEPFIVMEHLRGETLEVRLQKHGRRPLPLELAADIITDVCRALTVVHEAGIVHRDLKPANIIITPERGREAIKLVDFGVAALVRNHSAWSAVHGQPFAGTPRYMSPEQFHGKEPSVRTDLWALGVIAYEVMTGRQPFEAEDARQLRQQVLSGAHLKPSAVRPEAGLELDAFFLRAFDQRTDQRFQTAAEFASEFSRVVNCFERPPARLLFIDDEPDTHLLLEDMFNAEIERREYELCFSPNGADGLDVLRRRPDLDVVFTDLNMPGMDGLTFLQRVPDVNPFVRVVVVSAYDDMKNVRAAMNHGAFDFLCKPIQEEELRRTICKCADHVAVLRRTMRYSEENDILRVVLGPGVDQMISAIRVTDETIQEQFDGTIMFLGFGSADQRQNSRLEAMSLDHFSACYAAAAREIGCQAGVLQRVLGQAGMALFRGEGHCVRAVEAALALQERLRRCLNGEPTLSAAIGLETGQLVGGSIGSLAIGKLEQVTVGNAVKVASELQVVADLDEILLGPRIQEQIASQYRCVGVVPRPAEVHLTGPLARLVSRLGTRASLEPTGSLATEDDPWIHPVPSVEV